MRKFFEQIEKKTMWGIVVIVSGLITMAAWCIPVNELNYIELGKSTDDMVGPLVSGDVVELKSFDLVESKDIRGIEFVIATFGKTISNGEVIVQLIDNDSGTVFAEAKSSLEDFGDNRRVNVVFDEINFDSSNYNIKFYIYDISDAIALWVDSGNEYKIVSKEECYQGVLLTNIYYVSKNKPLAWQFSIFTHIIVLAFILADKKEKNDER